MSAVIKAFGAIGCWGSTPSELFELVNSGKLGNSSGESLWEGVAAERPEELLEGNLRPLNRAARLLSIAAERALADGGLSETDCHSTSLAVGTGVGGLETIAIFDRRAVDAGPRYVKPFDFANTVINAAAGQVAIRCSLRGPNATLGGGRAASIDAIGWAVDALDAGEAPVALAGGVESVDAALRHGFSARGLLSSSNPRPLGAGRDGCALSEAAVLLVLSTEGDGIGRILGVGSAFDHGRCRDESAAAAALQRAVNRALRIADLPAEAIDMVVCGVSGLTDLDRYEAAGLARALGEHRPPIGGVKASVGESYGASGAISTLFALECLRRSELPGLASGFDLDPELESLGLDITTETRSLEGAQHALVTALDSLGNASALVLSR